MEPLHHAAYAAKLNIIFRESGPEPEAVEYRVHLGNSHVLPPDFRRMTQCRVNPLLFLLNFAGSSLGNACIACGIFFLLWAGYTVFLFRRKIFPKKYADKSVAVWTENSQ